MTYDIRDPVLDPAVLAGKVFCSYDIDLWDMFV